MAVSPRGVRRRSPCHPDDLLVGTYLYADLCLGWIRSFRFDGATATEKTGSSGRLKGEMVLEPRP